MRKEFLKILQGIRILLVHTDKQIIKNEPMDNFRDLIVWNRAINLATLIYKRTVNFPESEIYGLRSQIRRAVVSISSNIAEGAGRRSKKEFTYFPGISYGSACELETQLSIVKTLDM